MEVCERSVVGGVEDCGGRGKVCGGRGKGVHWKGGGVLE